MADRMDVNSVLMQMRQVKDQLRSQHATSVSGAGAEVASNSVSNTRSVTNPFQAQLASQMQSIQNASSAQGMGYQPEQAMQAAPTRMNAYNLVQDGLVSESQPVSQVSGDPAIPNFQTMMGNAVDNVNQNQKLAADLARRFEEGEAGIDLPEVMIAMQKSSVSFQAMTQVRNKLVEAYKDVMNMPV